MTRVLRGRAGSLEDDRAVTSGLVSAVADGGGAAVRVWQPHRHVAFGRRDARASGYQAARETAREHGFPPIERRAGGRAVAYSGTTLAFVRITPIDSHRTGVQARYDRAVTDIQSALAELGVDARPGEPPAPFCPGAQSLRARGKLVGLAQRIGGETALVGGLVILRDHGPIASVLEPVYDALGLSFDPDSVGSIARAGGVADPRRCRRAIETALAGSEPHVSRIEDGFPGETVRELGDEPA